MDVNHITFERTGGFAGIRFAADFDLSSLPADQARTITGLLDDLDFANLPAAIRGNPKMADQFTYTVTVKAAKWQHTVVTGDTAAPEKLQQLLQILTQIAKRRSSATSQPPGK